MMRPSIPLDDMIVVAVMKVASKSSSRDAHGLIEDLEAMGFIKNAPAFNGVNVFLNKPEITPLLHELVRLSAAPHLIQPHGFLADVKTEEIFRVLHTISAMAVSHLEVTIMIDSSGFQTTSFNDWFSEKHKVKKEHEWLKIHACVGLNRGS